MKIEIDLDNLDLSNVLHRVAAIKHGIKIEEFDDQNHSWKHVGIAWKDGKQYRIKHKSTFIMVNGVKVPRPLEKAEDGQPVYATATTMKDPYLFNFLPARTVDEEWLAKGLLYSNAKDAQARIDAMLKFEECQDE